MSRIVLDGSIQFPVPENFAAWSYAWDEQSAQVGSRRGAVILTAHTYSHGVAIGNVLEGELNSGDLLHLSGARGSQLYRVASKQHLDAVEYSTLAQTWLDAGIKPQLTLTICSDYDPSSGEWRSRTVWVAVPVK